jgi:hypothetical protein
MLPVFINRCGAVRHVKLIPSQNPAEALLRRQTNGESDTIARAMSDEPLAEQDS